MNQYIQFTQKEIEYLQNNYTTTYLPELAKHIGRSEKSVRSKLHRMQLPIQTKVAQTLRETLTLHKQGKHKCPICQEIKPLTAEFFIRCYHLFRPECKLCYRKIAIKQKDQKYNSLETLIAYQLQVNKFTKYGKPSSITVSDVLELFHKQNGLCYYSGYPMTLKKFSDDCFSIDRKDSKIDYTKDNVVCCCRVVNRMKMQSSIIDFLTWNQRICDYQKQIK